MSEFDTQNQQDLNEDLKQVKKTLKSIKRLYKHFKKTTTPYVQYAVCEYSQALSVQLAVLGLTYFPITSVTKIKHVLKLDEDFKRYIDRIERTLKGERFITYCDIPNLSETKISDRPSKKATKITSVDKPNR